DIDAYDAYLITGSVAGVYEDFDWIQQLMVVVQEAYAKQKKIFGICFGHQLISQAFGGQVVKADSGYRIGVFDTEIVNAPDWLNTDVESRNVVYFHQDRVIDLPDNATLIATTPGYDNSMYHIDNQVFCMQAHPEQSRESLLKFLNHMRDDISESLMTDAESSIQTVDADTLVYAGWIRSFLENA
ncbi:MAG: type 1 glutamine amidotransferase, partial [Aggregatilineales bacterium]